MTLNILSFKVRAASPQSQQSKVLSPEEIAAIRNRKGMQNQIIAKSQSKKLEELYEKFAPTGFGLLYNYHAFVTGNLIPEGCKLPKKADWQNLFSNLPKSNSGDGSDAGYWLKGFNKSTGRIPYWYNNSLVRPTYDLHMNIYGAGIRDAEGTISEFSNVGCFMTDDILTDITSGTKEFRRIMFEFNSQDASFEPSVWPLEAEEEYTNYKRMTSVRCMLDPAGTLYAQWYPGFIVRDVEGNKYGTMKFGTDIWLTSNLITKKFKNGLTIPSAYDVGFNDEESGYSYPNDNAANVGQSSRL